MADYNYNDYTLPALPDWDKETYPYAMILGVKTSFSFHLVCHSEPLTVRNVDGEDLIGFNVDTRVYAYTYSRINGDTDWVDQGDVTRDPADGVIWYYYNDVGEWIWCNHDIKDESGNVVYEATDPVPIEEKKYDLRSWLTGYALGLSGKPLPFTEQKKEPVAYLYNGVVLPKLPEWDKEKYPYAVIVKIETDTSLYYRLMCNKGDFSNPEINGIYNGGVLDDGLFIIASSNLIAYDTTGEEWTQTNYGIHTRPAIWTNYNLYYSSSADSAGKLCLAASEPVPVYE